MSSKKIGSRKCQTNGKANLRDAKGWWIQDAYFRGENKLLSYKYNRELENNGQGSSLLR